MSDQHPLPPSPSAPDAPTALTVYTDRLARCLSYSDSSAPQAALNRIIARIIVRDLFRRAVHLPQVGWTVDDLVEKRPKDLLLLARRMRAVMRLTTDVGEQYSFALGSYQQSKITLPLVSR